jgi:septum formation topological specificity factor MinE
MSKYTCDCGKTINYNYRWKHFETKFHKNSPLHLEAQERKRQLCIENERLAIENEIIRVREPIEILRKYYEIDDDNIELMFDEINLSGDKQTKQYYIDTRKNSMEDMTGRFLAYDESNSVKEFGIMCVKGGYDFGMSETERLATFFFCKYERGDERIIVEKDVINFVIKNKDIIEQYYDSSICSYVLK